MSGGHQSVVVLTLMKAYLVPLLATGGRSEDGPKTFCPKDWEGH